MPSSAFGTDRCPGTAAIAAQKTALRRTMGRRARELSPDCRARASAAICRELLALPELEAAPVVFAFCPTPLEPDIAPVLRELLHRGKTLALPRCISPGVMEARRVWDLSALVPGAFRLPEPRPDAPLIPWGMLSFALVPCVAADRRGGRLGHGGGYYDRFLARAPGDLTAALVCFSALLTEEIPMDEPDIPVPLVVTEEGVWRKGVLRNFSPPLHIRPRSCQTFPQRPKGTEQEANPP